MSAAPPPPGARWVEKRDGRRVPFDKQKIARAVGAAQSALGQDDAQFAGEVADLVELELRRRQAQAREGPGAERIPTIEEIQDLVEEALVGFGRAALAKAYILYRDRRNRAREALAVELPDDAAARIGHLKVRDALGTSPWSKGRIVAALIEETGLERASAESVAARVEERVLRSGLRRVSTVLVRELVAAELVGLGLERALRRHEPLSVPRHDLRRLLGAGGEQETEPRGAPAGVEGALAGALLERYALEEIYDERSVELHLGGELELIGLRAPQRLLSLAVPAELLARGRPGTRAAFELLDELAGLAGGVARCLMLESPGALLQPLVRGVRTDSTSTLSAWLLALGALGRAAGIEVGLARIGARSSVLLGRLVEELARLEEAGGGHAPLPVLYVDESERPVLLGEEALRAGLERLLRAGLVRASFGRPESVYVGPALVRRGGEHGALACGGAVALDLPRVARRAGPWREDLCFEQLSALVQAAVEALARLDEFRRGLGAGAGERLRPRCGYALVPIGLVEALRVLGDGELRPAQGARLLGFLSEAGARFAAERGLVLDLDAAFGEQAAGRLARLDAQRSRVSQPLLFGGPAPGAPGRDAIYSTALALLPGLARDPREPQSAQNFAACGELLAGLPAGVLPREALLGAPSALDALEQIEERRAAARRAEREHVLLPRPTGPRRPTGPLFEPQAATGA